MSSRRSGTGRSRVRREDVKDLIAVMRGKGLGASRVREAHLVVAAIFNEAVRDKMIAASPCLSIALPEMTVNRDFIVPTATQMDGLAAGLPGDWAATIWLMHGCGLRVGEALAVRDRCVIGQGTTLRVREQVNPQGGCYYCEGLWRARSQGRGQRDQPGSGCYGYVLFIGLGLISRFELRDHAASTARDGA